MIILFYFKLQRLREESVNHQAKLISLEEDLSQARKACDVWRCKAMVAEQQRDEVYRAPTPNKRNNVVPSVIRKLFFFPFDRQLPE